MTIRYGSVCSGIEAATQAWHPLGWRPSFFSEIDPFCCHVLNQRWGAARPLMMPDDTSNAALKIVDQLPTAGKVPNSGDFTTIEAGQYDPIDILVGGTPCQSFSIAGLRGGLGDDRGNLSLEFLRLADRLRPRWLVWENVPGVLSSVSHTAPDPGPPPPPVDLGCDGAEMETQDEYSAEEVHAFNSFLAGFSEIGYQFAFRIIDAQYCRVDSFPHAVPQRRRRMFVVGHSMDWRRAAAVLFDRESMSGHPAPRREAGQRVAADVAPSLVSSGRGVERAGETRGQDPLVAVPVANSGDVGYCLTASAQQSLDAETETLIATVSGNEVSHALSAEGADASEDGTGGGTPIIAFSAKDHIQERAISENPNAGPDGAGGTLEARTVPQSVAHPLTAGMGASASRTPHEQGALIPESTPWRVRRLMPVECERLQGFPDGFTDIPWRGKDHAPDGRRYKALGNSMAVNVMEWIGRRIALVDGIAGE